jgi:hypothetical protein
MALTYVSITASYVPFVLKGIPEGMKNPQQQKTEQVAGTGGGQAPAAGAASAAPKGGDKPGLPLPLALVAFAALVFGLAFASPFLAGASNIMGLIIIGIALYEAWKLTRRVPITGPFGLAPAEPTSTAAGGG